MLNPLLRLYRSVQELIEQISEDWAVNHRGWTMPGFRAIAVHRFGTWVSNKRPLADLRQLLDQGLGTDPRALVTRLLARGGVRVRRAPVKVGTATIDGLEPAP